MPGDPLPTAEQLEAVFHAALKAGDVNGVEASLMVMARVDPHLAGELYEDLKVAVRYAQEVRGD